VIPFRKPGILEIAWNNRYNYMKTNTSLVTQEILKIITKDRIRTNLLRNSEQKALSILVQRIPSWVVPDMLTFIGFLGSLTVLLSFILATYFSRYFLLLSLAGFFINWFGDSLDGRLAIYRNKSRKWYGFSLDLSIDWITTIVIGLGFVIYTEGVGELLGYGFVVLYGWAMITTLMRYKITGEYTIDSGLLGPTEVRIIISAILVTEVLVKDSLVWVSGLACIILLIIDIHDLLKLLKVAAEKDEKEKQKIPEQSGNPAENVKL
jgi:hypothetical protein